MEQDPPAGVPLGQQVMMDNLYAAAIQYGNNLDKLYENTPRQKSSQFFKKKYYKPRHSNFRRRHNINKMDVDSEPDEESNSKEESEEFFCNLMFFKKHSKEKQAELRNKRLCFYCEKPGHMATQCPDRPKQTFRKPGPSTRHPPRQFQGKRRFKPRINNMDVDEEDYLDEPNSLEDQAFQINEMITNLNDDDRSELFEMLDSMPDNHHKDNKDEFDEYRNF